jgi:uncharacterized protein YndB with AHSA1/START domain
MTTQTRTTQVFRVHIRATAEEIWTAITNPEWTSRYGYATANEYDLRPGGSFRGLANEGMKAMGTPDVVVEGEVLEVDPPRRLVQTWRLRFMPDQSEEPLQRVTYEIEDAAPGVCRLTVVHDVTDAPVHAAMTAGDELHGAGGGWPFILSDLKSLLETGHAMSAPQG